MHKIRLLQSATHDLERLDKSTAARIVQRMKWLAENIDSIAPKRLTGPLAGLCKLREGDYRIIYQELPNEETIVIHAIGHRRDIYRKR
jgi:mRNA interferase RelE/StbE